MRMVLLRHELPDGSWHLDWMIQTPDGARGLVSFRTTVRPDGPESTQFDAERLPDHRAAYLDYEGPVSGGRGEVRRVTGGTVERFREWNGGLEVAGRLGDVEAVWVGRDTGGRWVFARSGLRMAAS